MKRYDERCCSGVTGWDRVMWDLVICRWWQKLADFSEPKCWIMHCYTLLGLLPCKYLCVFDTTREALWVDLFSWGRWHGDVLQLSQDTRKQPPPGNWVCKACCDKTLTASEDIDLPALLNVYGCTSSMLNGKPRSFFEDLVCCVCVCIMSCCAEKRLSSCRSLYAARSWQSVSRMRQEGEKKCMCLVWCIIESVPVSAMIKYIRWRIRRWTNYPLYNVEYHWRGIYLRNPVYAMSPTTCLVAPRLRLCILQVRILTPLHAWHLCWGFVTRQQGLSKHIR